MSILSELLSIKKQQDLHEELSSESVAHINKLLQEGQIGNYLPPFKAEGLWVSDKRGTSVLEVTRPGTAKEIANALNMFTAPKAVKESAEELSEMSSPRTADQLHLGDTVEITGDVNYQGSVGHIDSFGTDKKFVIVNLYGIGKKSFHSSDVTETSLDDEDEEEDSDTADFYVAFYDEDENSSWIGKVTQAGSSKWVEKPFKGKPDYRWGQTYMSYLSPNDVMTWIRKDYGRGMEIEGPFSDPQQAIDYVKHNFGPVSEAKEVASSGIFSITCDGSKFTLKNKSAKIATFDHHEWTDLVDAVKNRTTGTFGQVKLAQKGDSYTLLNSKGDEVAYLSATEMDDLAKQASDYLQLNEETVYTDFNDWKKAVLNSYPAQAKKIIFRGRMEGKKTTISAEIPGQDRSYGVWDQDDEEGVVLSEAEEYSDEVHPADVGEYDHEGRMAKSQFIIIQTAAEELSQMISDDENLPEWVQSKITIAQDYLVTVRDYLKAKKA